MPRALPYLLLPTPEARRTALIYLRDNDLYWGGFDEDSFESDMRTLSMHERSRACDRAVSLSDGTGFAFENAGDMDRLSSIRRDHSYVQTNSLPHFASAVRAYRAAFNRDADESAANLEGLA